MRHASELHPDDWFEPVVTNTSAATPATEIERTSDTYPTSAPAYGAEAVNLDSELSAGHDEDFREAANLVDAILAREPEPPIQSESPEYYEEPEALLIGELAEVVDEPMAFALNDLDPISPEEAEGKLPESDDWLFDDGLPDLELGLQPDRTSPVPEDLLTELLDERRYFVPDLVEEPNWRINQRAANLVFRLPIFRRHDVQPALTRLRTLLSDFRHGASHFAISSLVDEGLTLDALEEIAKLKRFWIAEPALWLYRKYDRLQSCWSVMQRDRRGQNDMTWRLARYLLTKSALETVQDSLISEWRSEWLRLDISDFRGSEEVLPSFYYYSAYIALRRVGGVLADPDRWPHEHLADRSNYWREFPCDGDGHRLIDPPTLAFWTDRR